MKKRIICIITAIAVVTLMSGCELDIEDLAEKADSAIGNNQNVANEAGNSLNEIVSEFEEQFGDLENYLNK